ncbi:MAG: hypothetical protein Q9225_000301 [Loekoesia sp. 1 TL-2023]
MSITKPTSTAVDPGTDTAMSNTHTTSMGHGKPIPTSIAKSIVGSIPKGDGSKDLTHSYNSDAMKKTAEASTSQSFGQKSKHLTHKPVFWAVIIGLSVLVIATIIIACAIKKRKQKRINDEKTRKMMHWHRNQGMV